MLTLDSAIKLRESGRLEEANLVLKTLVDKYPDVAEINYQLAWCYDVMGLEHEALVNFNRIPCEY